MSGRSISIKWAFFAGIRVLGQLTYVPAHHKNGKEINARATIPVRANSHRGTDRKGQPGRYDDFKLTVWGKLADTCCRSCSPGKCLDIVAEPNSYLGKTYNPDGSLRLDAAGQPIETNKVGFTVREIVFGEESRKFIQDEITAGKRPVHWDVPGTVDAQNWLTILQSRQAVTWDGRDQLFGYARVVVPQGPGIQLMAPGAAAAPVYTQPGQQAAPTWVNQAPVAMPTQYPVQQPVYGQNPLPVQVAQAFPPVQPVYAQQNAQPGTAPVATVGKGF